MIRITLKKAKQDINKPAMIMYYIVVQEDGEFSIAVLLVVHQ